MGSLYGSTQPWCCACCGVFWLVLLSVCFLLQLTLESSLTIGPLSSGWHGTYWRLPKGGDSLAKNSAALFSHVSDNGTESLSLPAIFGVHAHPEQWNSKGVGLRVKAGAVVRCRGRHELRPPRTTGGNIYLNLNLTVHQMRTRSIARWKWKEYTGKTINWTQCKKEAMDTKKRMNSC